MNNKEHGEQNLDNYSKVGENIARSGYETVNPGTGGTGQQLDFDKMSQSMKEGHDKAKTLRENLGLPALESNEELESHHTAHARVSAQEAQAEGSNPPEKEEAKGTRSESKAQGGKNT